MAFPKDPKAAYHEASHAVVAHELRKPVKIVSIGGDPTAMRFMRADNLFDWEQIDASTEKGAKKRRHGLRQHVTILIAGDQGEYMSHKTPKMSDSLPQNIKDFIAAEVQIPGLEFKNTDRARVLFLIQNRMDRPIGVEMVRAEDQAERILKRRWDRVHRIADKLVDHGFLEGDALQAALR